MTRSFPTSSGCPVLKFGDQMESQSHRVSAVSLAPLELSPPGMSGTSHWKFDIFSRCRQQLPRPPLLTCGRVSSPCRRQCDTAYRDERDRVRGRLPPLRTPPCWSGSGGGGGWCCSAWRGSSVCCSHTAPHSARHTSRGSSWLTLKIEIIPEIFGKFCPHFVNAEI